MELPQLLLTPKIPPKSGNKGICGTEHLALGKDLLLGLRMWVSGVRRTYKLFSTCFKSKTTTWRCQSEPGTVGGGCWGGLVGALCTAE